MEKVYCSNYDDSLPVLSRRMAIICLVLNSISVCAGLGTIVSAFAGKSYNWKAIMIGLLQGISSIVIVGHFWAIIHGVWLLEKHFAQINECFDCKKSKHIKKEIENDEAEVKKNPAH